MNRFADANFSDIAKEVDYHFQRAHLSYDENDWMNLALEYYCDEVGAEFDQVDYDWFVEKMHNARRTKKVTVGTATKISERIGRVVRSIGAFPDRQEMNTRFSDFIYDKLLGERGQLQDYGECEFEHWGDDWGGLAGVHVTDKKNLYYIDFLLTPRGKMQATIHMPHWGAEDFISEEVVGRPEGAWLEFFNKMMLRFYGEIEKHLEGKAKRTAETRGVPSTYDIAEVLLADAMTTELEYWVEDKKIDRLPWGVGTELTGWMASEIPGWEGYVKKFYSENSKEIDDALEIVEKEEEEGWEKESWAGSWVVYIVNETDLEGLRDNAYTMGLDILDENWGDVTEEEEKEGFIKRTPGKEKF